MPESEVEQLRQEIAEIAGKIRMAHGRGDLSGFHYNVGMLVGLAFRLHEANAKAERGET